MLHAWLTVNYFWLTDNSQVHHHIVEYGSDGELTDTVAQIYRDLEEELGNATTKRVGVGRVKIQGSKGFAVVDIDEGFTREQLVRMGMLDEEEAPATKVDTTVWGSLLSFEPVEGLPWPYKSAAHRKYEDPNYGKVRDEVS